MSLELPEELYNYEKPDKLHYGIIDAPIQELVWEINQTDWMWATFSCAGHPGSERVSEWSIDYLTFSVCFNDEEKFDEWRRLFEEDIPDRYEDRKYLTRVGKLLPDDRRKKKLEINYSKNKEGWQKVKIRYEISTVGERDAMVDILREALRQVE